MKFNQITPQYILICTHVCVLWSTMANLPIVCDKLHGLAKRPVEDGGGIGGTDQQSRSDLAGQYGRPLVVPAVLDGEKRDKGLKRHLAESSHPNHVGGQDTAGGKQAVPGLNSRYYCSPTISGGGMIVGPSGRGREGGHRDTTREEVGDK